MAQDPCAARILAADWRRLVPQGIVVLTYDKRGVGESSGRFQEVRIASSEEQLRTLAADARACLEFLKSHPRVDPKRVGFFGGSQAVGSFRSLLMVEQTLLLM